MTRTRSNAPRSNTLSPALRPLRGPLGKARDRRLERRPSASLRTLGRGLALGFSLLMATPAVAAPDSLLTLETAPDVILTGLGADLDGSMSIAGMSLDSSTMFTPLRGRAFFGTLSGLSDVSGDLATTPSSAQTGGATDFGATLWIAQGDEVLRRDASGWSNASAPARLDALHAFDSSRVIGVGVGGSAGLSTDGGASWTAIATGTDADLTGMYWQDDQVGWAWGGTIETTGGGFDGGDEQRSVLSGVLLRSDDAGGSWSVITERPGELVGPAFFLAGGERGWMATAQLAAEGTDADAALWTTQDGGRSWAAVALPELVGTLKTPFSTEDVALSYVRSMWWDNSFQGRLFASAHLADSESTGSGSGGGTTINKVGSWKIVELVTHDGGVTWQYNHLGETELEISFGGATMEHDGEVTQGTALSWSRHVLLGSEGRVWRTADWGDDPEHESEGGEGGSGGEGGGEGGGARGPGERDTPGGGSADSGCSAGGAGALGAWWALFSLGLWRRRA